MRDFRQLLDAGKLDEAIEGVTAELRARPDDLPLRTTLFELLSFSGRWDRAEKQLDVLASTPERKSGALVYLGAITGERAREETVSQKRYGPAPDGPAISGSLNGRPVSTISDADPRIGARLEAFIGPDCMWIPFAQIASIHIEPPRRLRDLIWIPAELQLRETASGAREGQVLLPVLTVFSSRHPDPQVRLGRITVWEQNEDGEETPAGQKMLIVDGEEISFLEIRDLAFEHAAAAA